MGSRIKAYKVLRAILDEPSDPEEPSHDLSTDERVEIEDALDILWWGLSDEEVKELDEE